MKALKFLFVALALLMVAPTFTSCKDDEKDEPGAPQSSALVGTWVYTEEDFSSEFVFSSNGTFVITEKEYYNGKWETDSEYGTYTFDGTTLTLRYSDGYVDSLRITTLKGNYFVSEYGDTFYKR